MKNHDELDGIIIEQATRQTPAAAMTPFQKVNIASDPVYSSEVMTLTFELGIFGEINHPEAGKRELSGLFARLNETPSKIRSRTPLLGEHNGWSLEKITRR